jgi:hypothetical protein
VFSIGLAEFQNIAAYGDLTPPEFAALAARLEVEDELERGAVRAMQREFAYMVPAIEGGKEQAREGVANASPFGLLYRGARDPLPLSKPNMCRNAYGRHLEGVLNVIESYRPYPEEPEAGRESALDGLLALARRYGVIPMIRNPIGFILVDLLRRPTERMSIEHHSAVARTRMTRLMLVLRAYEVENGEMPDTLDTLAPDFVDEVPVDPFTEEPFIYEPDGDPPRLLSVGPDQKPDGEGKEKPDDIVVELTFRTTKSQHGGTEDTENGSDD